MRAILIYSAHELDDIPLSVLNPPSFGKCMYFGHGVTKIYAGVLDLINSSGGQV